MRNAAALTLVPNAAPDRVAVADGDDLLGPAASAGSAASDACFASCLSSREHARWQAIERAVGHASADLEAAGLLVTLHAREPIWLPETGTRLYRPIRRLLGAVCTEATPGPVKIGVLDLVGERASSK